MAGPLGASGPRLGRVASYDGRRGVGVVSDDDGDEYAFHATAIADGTRSIAPGTRVAFLVAPGRRGAYEASGVTALADSDSADSHHAPA